MGASAMAADNKGADALTNAEKGALNICDVVSEGVFNISAMHQSNISEAEAKKPWTKSLLIWLSSMAMMK